MEKGRSDLTDILLYKDRINQEDTENRNIIYNSLEESQ